MNMKKTFDYTKEQCRGTLKQIMKVRGLRTISIANYADWAKKNGLDIQNQPVHSLKIDLQDGYINAYGWHNGKCGDKIEDLSTVEYKLALNIVNDILEKESLIPYKTRRNILVRMGR